MPIPKPKAKESHDKFMERCMGNDAMVKEFPDEKQRYAVCQKQWDDKNTKADEPDGVERRYFTLPVEIRADGDDAKKKLAGYAAIFNSITDIGWFREQIAPGCFAEAVQEDDIRCLFNHDPNYVLGRNKAGTLTVKEDEKGLFFEDAVPDTQVGRDTLTSVDRGDVTGCSFAFRAIKDEWDESDPDHPLRTLKKVRLYDVAICTYPAYADTSVAARSWDAVRAAKEQREQLPAPETTPIAAQPPEPTPEQLAAQERQAKAQSLYEECGKIIERNRPAKS